MVAAVPLFAHRRAAELSGPKLIASYALGKRRADVARRLMVDLAFGPYVKYVWRTRYPDNSGKPGKKRPTAAMMAGITGHLWTFDELYQTTREYEGTPAK